MNFSGAFIRRPIATTLLTVGLTLAGLAALGLLPVSPMPQVDFPTITVSASLPGASPETMATTVATPLERQLGRIAGVTEMTSTSSLGSTRVVLQFDLDRDINGAARDVQAAINAATAQLPENLPSSPTYRKINPADAPIMILSMTSDTMDRGQMYDAASTIVAQKLSQVDGVGSVSVGGSSLPAVRVEINPTALNKYGISVEQVGAAITAANAARPRGSVEDNERHWQISTNDQGLTAEDYLPLIIAYRNRAPVRLADVSQVVDSVQDLRNAGSSNGRPSVLLILHRQPNANIVETVDRVIALLPELRASIPHAIDLGVAMHRTATIRASLFEVETALVVAMGLVILVVFLFLRNSRAALIPSAVVPVSLVGTFAVMYLLDYSLDNLSLMALTIATGFVVDDAIVVLENVSRHIERGVAPREAALRGVREVGFTVLSMSLSLIAVFIPIFFMDGMAGRLFREFAVTLSVAVILSLVLSLTTTPMMCAQLLKRRRPGKQSKLSRMSGGFFKKLLRCYQTSLMWALRHPRLILSVLFITICLNVYLYTIIPKGFFPRQDTGRLNGTIRGDQSISFQAMRDKLANFIKIVREDPAVDTVVGFTGGAQRNTGSMFISLKPLSERKVSADEVIARLRQRLTQEPGASLILRSVQDVRVGGRESNAQYQYTLQSSDLNELKIWTLRLESALNEIPQLEDVNTDQQDRGLQTAIIIDKATAARLGVTPRMVDSALYNAFGQRPVSTIYGERNQYRVIIEVAPQYSQRPESLEDIYIRTMNAGMVPLSAFSRYESVNTPLVVQHQGGFAAATISFNLATDVALSDAVAAIDDTAKRIGMPASIYGGYQGTARAFQLSVATQPLLILAALVAVYIVLGILYESYVHPLTIISTLPSAGVGAILALLLFQVEFNFVGLIGVMLLIGIVKKNAILMIDFALEAERKEGKRPAAAIYQACLLRFRPIMMTTVAALFGAVPLAIGFGEGSELRRPLGISIVGGLIMSQALTLYTTPVVYLYLDRLRRVGLRRRNRVATDSPVNVSG